MPRLTEQEQQDIVRYLEADKPLPESIALSCSRKSARWSGRNGKTSEVRNRAAIPGIEQVDEPRADKAEEPGQNSAVRYPRPSDEGLDEQANLGRQQVNLSSLKNGPMRRRSKPRAA